MRTVRLEILVFWLLCSTQMVFVNVASENLASNRSTIVKEVSSLIIMAKCVE